MKKKIMFLSLVFALSASAVFAQGTDNGNSDVVNPGSTQEDKGDGQGSAVQENRPGTPQGEGTGDSVQEQSQTQERTNEQSGESVGEPIRQQERASTTERLREMIAEKSQEIGQAVQGINDAKQRGIYENQHRTNEAVHALLAAEDLVGGIGPEVSRIAGEFNDSMKKTIAAETKIQDRNGIVKFFFGGDKEATEDILQETTGNQMKLQELKNLHQECDCDPEVKDIIMEQVQNLEQEQNRLGQLAQAEKSSKGIFGWLFGWMQ